MSFIDLLDQFKSYDYMVAMNYGFPNNCYEYLRLKKLQQSEICQ